MQNSRLAVRLGSMARIRELEKLRKAEHRTRSELILRNWSRSPMARQFFHQNIETDALHMVSGISYLHSFVIRRTASEKSDKEDANLYTRPPCVLAVNVTLFLAFISEMALASI